MYTAPRFRRHLSQLLKLIPCLGAFALAQDIPKPIFYLPFDGNAIATIAEGSAVPQLGSQPDAILTLADQNRQRTFSGKVGQCYDLSTSPLVFRCKGNFRADEGTCSFWLQPHFQGDNTNIYCTFFGAADWGMLYKYVSQTSLTFGTAKPKGDLYYDCVTPVLKEWQEGEWHHVAVTWSRQENAREIYVDGTLVETAPFIFHRPVEDGPLFIGSGCTLYPGHVAHANMDEVAFWDRALSAAVVTRLYNLGQQGKPLWTGSERIVGTPESSRLPEVVPATKLPEDAQEPVASATASHILSLDGWWHVLPASRPLAQLPTEGWGTTLVPGYWATRDATLDPQGQRVGSRWAGEPVASFPLTYYQRSFAVPEEWPREGIFLHLGGVDGLAEIFLNGKRLAWLPSWEPETYRVSDLLRRNPDERNTLTIALHVQSGSSNVGIFGNVSVQAETGAHICNTAVTTSVAEKRIRFSCDVWNSLGEADAELVFEIQARDAPVKTLKSFRHVFRLKPADRSKRASSESCQRVECSFPWSDAHLWTYDDPFLYLLTVSLATDATIADQSTPVRFGFREFTMRGSKFLLNGVPTHLRGHQIDLAWGDQMSRVKELKSAGMNCFEFSGPKSHSWYGRHIYRLELFEEILDYADESGLIAIPILPGTREFKDRIFEPEVATRYRQRVDKHIRRFGNHPSICMWFMHFNLAGYRWYLAPTKIDGSYKPDGDAFLTKERYSLEAQRLALENDTRPLYHHACGNLGDIFSMNCYIGPTCPLQEREEWPVHWAKKRPFPLLACEHGLMLIPYWFRPRKFPLSEVYADEPLFDEIAAKYLGRQAYDMLTPELFDLYDTGRDKPRGSRLKSLIRQHPGYQEVKSLFARYSLRSWRAYGVSGIIFNAINWDFKDTDGNPLPVMQALGRYFNDTDMFLAGPEGDWPSKDHAFFSGETVHKQVVLLNDLTRDLPVVLDWELTDSSGHRAASGTLRGVARAGRATMLPFSCPLPTVDARSEFGLTVKPQAQNEVHFQPDGIEFQVFPREPKHEGTGSVLLFDPVGDTSRLLQQAGFATRPLGPTSDLSTATLLIVGSRTCNGEFATLARDLNLDEAIRNGLNLLVFEQTTESPWGLTLHEQSARRTFIAAPGHPFLDGLKAEDFINLRGESTLMEPYPQADPETEKRWPERFFKTGNRGVVASYVYTKPHYAPFVPILECGFDLVDSPLLEARIGNGRIALCQVDVTSRYGVDPVSTRLVRNLLDSLGRRQGSRPNALVCTDAAARAFVRQFGVQVSDHADTNASLFVVGDEALTSEMADSLISSAGQGATILFLPGAPAISGLQMDEKKLFIGRPKSHTLLAGISAADLYLKQWHTLPVCLPENGWEVLIEPGLLAEKILGKGRLIACTLSPDVLRGTRGHAKVLRFWNLLLANLGAPRENPNPAAPIYEENQYETIPPYMNW